VRPARVLHVITRLIVGGAQETTVLAAALVDPERFPSAIMTCVETGSEGELWTEARARGIPLHFEPALVRDVHPAKDALALARLTAFFRRERPDIVHTHSSKAGIVGRMAARLAGVPRVVHTAQGGGFRPTQPWHERALFGSLERACGALSDRIGVVSRPTLEFAVTHRIGPRERFVVLRDGVEVERFARDEAVRAAMRARFGFAPDQFVFGFVSRFSPPKEPQTVVRAFARVAARHPGARLVLVGDGALRPATEQLIAELGLADRVRLTGLSREVPALLSAFDAFVLATSWEGLPIVLTQALAASLPIVTTECDGTPEAVRDGVTGWLVPVGDFETMVDRMQRLADDPAQARRMGLAGFPLVR